MPEIRYVRRNEDGKIVATFAVPQPGKAEEAIPDDHPDMIAFAERPDADQN